ncbi:hypothetical protein FRC20_008552 [Serendipita sp. 405]|nr:hypothetical protein FRC20_008552 [Serendipita sp. 405]
MSSVSLPPPSGSAKLYATAKREWVIAPRAKPGRKPKQIPQDEAEYVQDDASEKGKKTQNRAAQRAFRERRQSQLSELQVRLQQYEQGEVERNVALQQLGKRLKEENEQLKQDNLKLTTENERLKARIATLEAAHAAAAWPSTSGAHNISSRKTAKRDRSEHSPPLRRRLKRLKTTESPVLHPSSTDTPSISSCASTNIIMSPMISALEDDDMMAIDTCNTTNLDGNIQEEDPDFTSCGMCTSSVDCICRQLGIDNRAPITIADEPSGSLSLLDNLPPYQPPVPLRHRRKSDPISSRPLPTNTRSSSQATSLGCSGDPSNCSACAGNAFGRAFCSALGNSVCTGTSCSKCHSKSSSPPPEQDRSSVVPLPRSINPSLTQCCGNPGQCRGSACSTINSVTARLEGRPTDVPGPSNLKSEDAEDDDIPMEEDNNVPCDVTLGLLILPTSTFSQKLLPVAVVAHSHPGNRHQNPKTSP